MARKTKTKRMERLESVCIGAGFLLMKLQMQFGNAMGEGMRKQVAQCVNDCNQIARSIEQRKAVGQEGGAA